jgi:hypothetical protein
MAMTKFWTILGLTAGLTVLAGCGGEPVAATTAAKPAEVAEADDDGGHGWWCAEHGVKEDECSICQKEVFKKLKPDEICPNHPDRAKAQCFVCNPQLWEKSKATYVAKYGKEPPLPDDNKPTGK